MSTCIWNFLLGRINICNLAIQGKEATLDQGIKHVEGLLLWLKGFQKDGFKQCLQLTTEKANLLGIEERSGFSYRMTRTRKPERFSDDLQISRPTADNPIEANIARFEKEFFDTVLLEIIEETERRFLAVKKIHLLFSFMWGGKLESQCVEEHAKCVELLCSKFSKDFDLQRFQREIKFLASAVKPFLPPNTLLQNSTPIIILNVLTMNSLQSQFENCHTALIMYLTFPVTVASNERAFSKLKIIKNYLRSSMAQERLTNLAIISIEKEHAENVDYDEIIKEFASTKCRQYQSKN